MNTKLTILTLATLLICQPALANGGRHHHGGDDRYDGDTRLVWAPVTRVTPIYEEVEEREPYEDCRVEYRTSDDSLSSATPVIIGGIVGAAIGNQLGHHKRNKQVGAIAGGLLGAAIGSDVGRSMGQRGGSEEVAYEVCDTRYRIETHREITGYDVRYRYDGHSYTTRTSEDPGERIQVRVHIEPYRY